MARISRITQKIFAGSASNNGVFGSAQDGTKVLSNSLTTLMSKAAWLTGWVDAIMGSSKFPPLEEFQAVSYVHSTQIAYLLQQGIAEYDSGTTYYVNNICVKPLTYELYGSITNTNVGNALPTAPASNTNWKFLGELSGGRIKLTSAANYYVATTGNDSNPGTIGSPWLTIQHALDYVKSSIDLGGYALTINVADGTYTGNIIVTGAFEGSGSVVLKGNVTTPANCILQPASGDCITLSNGAILSAGGFKFIAAAGNAINVGPQCLLTMSDKMDFGACAAGYHLYANFGGQIIITANYNITGGAGRHYNAFVHGVIQAQNITVTLTGTPAFSQPFANASNLGMLEAYTMTFSGSATGIRYSCSANSAIDTGGGGASYFPGNSAGSTATGGQYI